MPFEHFSSVGDYLKLVVAEIVTLWFVWLINVIFLGCVFSKIWSCDILFLCYGVAVTELWSVAG